jgi:transposase
MANVLSEEKRQRVLVLGGLGWSLRRIEEATGVRRETASGYLKAAGVEIRAPRNRRPPKPASEVSTDFCRDMSPACEASAGAGPDSKPASEVSTDPKPASEVSTDSADEAGPAVPFGADGAAPAPVAGRAPSASACEPYRELIELELAKGRNAMAIWQDLVTDHEFPARYASVMRFVGKLRGGTAPEERAVIETPPGEEAQVDYGDGPMVRHPETGKYRRTRLFVMTLGYSRKCVRLLTFKSSTRTWCELHETAFRRLDGAAAVVVLDNLKEGVLKPDIYDPELNPLYRDLLKHYGAVALPCRVRDPDRKGKVESGVGHAKRTPLKGLRFESLEDAQAYLDRWEERWADTRIHGTTKRQVAAMFVEERPHLRPLPLEPFRFYRYGMRTVHLDGCVEVDAAYYHAPPGWIGKELHVQWDGWRVRLIHPTAWELLREYSAQRRGGRRKLPGDEPKRTPPRITKLLAAAALWGSNIGTLCETMHRRDGESAVRRIQGVLSLVRRYGETVVDEVCATALEAGVVEYRFVRRCLDHQVAVPLTLKQVDPLIRELSHYRDLITHRTEGDNP